MEKDSSASSQESRPERVPLGTKTPDGKFQNGIAARQASENLGARLATIKFAVLERVEQKKLSPEKTMKVCEEMVMEPLRDITNLSHKRTK